MQLTYLSGEFGVLKLFIKMNISANTLFHFVSQRKFLKDILHGKLIPRYCVEHFEINDYLKGDVVIPMKCFCDIPLSQIYEHTNTYGKFAIGITEEWAQKEGITPVIYIHNQSPQIQDILPKDSLHGFGESRWLHGWIFPRYEEKMHFRICLNN